MLKEPRCAFLLVRSHADLERSNRYLSAYLSSLRDRSSDSDFEYLQGIWIDENGVANLPDALVLPDSDGAQRSVRILEASGINGIWMLCWLEATSSAVSLVDLVTALLTCFGHEGSATLEARFIPVITENTTNTKASSNLQILETHYPKLVLPPIYQHPSGALILASAQAQHEGTRF